MPALSSAPKIGVIEDRYNSLHSDSDFQLFYTAKIWTENGIY